MRKFLLVLAAALALAQSDREIPRCKGQECQGDNNGAMHEGQPAWCQNQDRNGYKANCACKRSCEKDRGSDCKTYCRTPKCRCDHGCPMT